MPINIKNFSKNKTALSYTELIFVVLVWGTVPLLYKYLLIYFSASVRVAVSAFFCFSTFFFISIKKLKLLNKQYFKVAVPTGLFYSVASVLQKIGLNYTTPTVYAFLENLSCVIVPFLMLLFIKKKPNLFTIIAGIVCLSSSLVLSFGNISGSTSLGVILCAIAGIFYGVNIAGTGAFAKDLDVTLYLTIQMFIEFIISSLVAISLNFIKKDGVPIETAVFPLSVLPILFCFGVTLISSVLCWGLRTSAMKYVNASVVAIIMPFSAVITGATSVIFGMDKFSVNLLIGAILGVVAIFLSSLGDMLDAKKQKANLFKDEDKTATQNDDNP